MNMEPWQAPKAPTTLSTLLGLSGLPGVLGVGHTFPGNPWPSTLPTEINLSATNAITVTLPLVNATGWKASIVPSKGTYSGSFNVPNGSATQNVKFSGILSQALSGETLIGSGHYLYTPPASTTQVSGEVEFTR
jgi:hypothetical protein